MTASPSETMPMNSASSSETEGGRGERLLSSLTTKSRMYPSIFTPAVLGSAQSSESPRRQAGQLPQGVKSRKYTRSFFSTEQPAPVSPTTPTA